MENLRVVFKSQNTFFGPRIIGDHVVSISPFRLPFTYEPFPYGLFVLIAQYCSLNISPKYCKAERQTNVLEVIKMCYSFCLKYVLNQRPR